MEVLIQKRKVEKQRATRLCNYADSNTTTSVNHNDIQVRLSKLEECLSQFNQIQESIEALCLEDELLEAQESEREIFETKYFKTKSALLSLLHQLPTTVPTAVPTAASGTSATVRLPKLELPIFNGNYQEWYSFHDLFVALVHNNDSLRPAQKLHYLKGTLRDEAARLLLSMQVTDANYAEAWEILRSRYQNKRHIIQSHIKSLFTQPSLQTESASALRKLLDNTVEHIRALQALGEPTEHWGSIIIHMVVERMDSDSRRQWELSTPTTETPKFDELKSFLEQRCRALDAAGTSKPKQAQFVGRQGQHVKSHNTNSTAAYHATSKATCTICSADHLVYQCPRFNQATHAERIAMTRQHGLCFNCLRGNHSARQCKSSSLCRKCNQHHHTLLHADQTSTPRNVTPSEGNQQHVSTHTTTSHDEVLLLTALVNVPDRFGKQQLCRALIDSGSQSSFITEPCVQRLQLYGRKVSMPIQGIGNRQMDISNSIVQVQVLSNTSNYSMQVTAYVIPRITGKLPATRLYAQDWNYLKPLKLADPTFNIPGDVDLLLGADIFAELLLEGKIIGVKGAPSAQNTVFGWILSGKVCAPQSSNNRRQEIKSNLVIDCDNDMRRFWELEEVPRTVKLTEDEMTCETHFATTHSRDECGRYTVRLPFRKDAAELGQSRERALKRFTHLEKGLNQSALRREHYSQFLQEYLDLGHMEPIDIAEQNSNFSEGYYLPHHAVFKSASSTTNLRVVFDASAKTSSGIALNDTLLVGPRLQDDLIDIIMRFRQHKIAFTADIEKMYRQVRLHPEDTKYQKIIWRPSPKDQLSEFKLTTVTYGVASAPYLATKALQQVAHDEENRFPLAAQSVLHDFYVDDLMSGSDELPEALELQQQLIELLKSGGFPLRKWSSNHQAILAAVPVEDRETQLPLEIDAGIAIKTLGIHWNPASDQFTFRVSFPKEISVVTKRTMLSDICKLYDPLGWIAPCIITAKIMIQRLWLLGLQWDDELPIPLRDEWIQFRTQLPTIQEIRINRWVKQSSSNVSYELHGFCDASELAYGAAVYLRIKTDSNEVFVNLIASKTRVAPIKQVSLPRLELCGALLLAKLMSKIMSSMSVSDCIYAWTDSTIVLSWISDHPSRWKSFVANRVTEIHSILSPAVWNHVSSEDNPTDCASRGLAPNNLANHPLWWSGPTWLRLDNDSWPQSTWHKNESAKSEIKPLRVLVTTSEVNEEWLTNISSLTRLKRVTAYCFRFIRNARAARNERTVGNLSSQELRSALMHWIKVIQRSHFQEEIHSLRNKEHVPTNSRLIQLSPFLDTSEILRVGGRLRNSGLRYDVKHPILLPKKHHLTSLIIEHEHVRHLHAGPQLVLAALQGQYWIINARDVVRRHIHKCIKCFRQRAQTCDQLMGDLPSYRLEAVRPFLRCGVDYGGPITMKWAKGRGKTHHKAYICLFVCLTVKAVHIELVSELTTDAFLNAFRRFLARRGKCSDMYSDNGTNFVGAHRALDELQRLMMSQSHKDNMSKALGSEGIKWHFIPPNAPHFGGLWEVSIKAVKYHLRRIVGNNVLTFEELYTLLTQIEACLNSRPLTPLSSDPNDLSALTPGHFLIGDSLTSFPEPDLSHLNINRLSRWQVVQQLSQQFWKRWQSEYLTRLQQRPKWNVKRSQVAIGDLVLLKEDNLPRLKWKLARVTHVHPGPDAQVRVVTVKTSNGSLKRPIVKICQLPLEN